MTWDDTTVRTRAPNAGVGVHMPAGAQPTAEVPNTLGAEHLRFGFSWGASEIRDGMRMHARCIGSKAVTHMYGHIAISPFPGIVPKGYKVT